MINSPSIYLCDAIYTTIKTNKSFRLYFNSINILTTYLTKVPERYIIRDILQFNQCLSFLLGVHDKRIQTLSCGCFSVYYKILHNESINFFENLPNKIQSQIRENCNNLDLPQDSFSISFSRSMSHFVDTSTYVREKKQNNLVVWSVIIIIGLFALLSIYFHCKPKDTDIKPQEIKIENNQKQFIYKQFTKIVFALFLLIVVIKYFSTEEDEDKKVYKTPIKKTPIKKTPKKTPIEIEESISHIENTNESSISLSTPPFGWVKTPVATTRKRRATMRRLYNYKYK